MPTDIIGPAPVAPVGGTRTRAPGPTGSRARRPAHSEDLPGLGTLAATPLDPARHGTLLQEWVNDPRSRVWGMAGWTAEQVSAGYTSRGRQARPRRRAHVLHLDAVPVGLLETSDDDPAPGAVTMRLLLAPGLRPLPGFTPALGTAIARFLLAAPGRDRIVAETGAHDDLGLRRLLLFGFEPVPAGPDGTRRAELTRQRFDRLLTRDAGSLMTAVCAPPTCPARRTKAA